jgi:ADP-heptose:LPS heptosyltransferase
LLIRLDAIGDYILFRNFIESVSRSEKYKGYKITLLGNIVWKSLSEKLDSEYIVEFIWLDIEKVLKNFYYRYRIFKQIASKGYEVVINSTYSREFYYSDNIVKLVSANQKIGSSGSLNNIQPWQKKVSDQYYTQLIPAKNEILFEFYRNKEFFEYLLNEQIPLKCPFIKLKSQELKFVLPAKYFIVFIGASELYKRWSIEKFSEAAKYIHREYNLSLVLCGGPTDRKVAEKFSKYFDDDYIDLVGKTTLVDLLHIFSNSDLILTNETSAPHLAIALGKTRVFVIYSGIHYGRFTPYPKDVYDKYNVIYHPEIEKNLDNYKKISNSSGCGIGFNIDEISIKCVIDKIDIVLNRK